ncbi:MAG TPA: DUF6677 family protein [Gemmataceae bacterium]|jgi:hypothetical protein
MMSNAVPGATNPPASLDWIGGVLSYLVPGMGQISQGRVSKGVLFFASVYVLYFYGMYLGSWQNVYLPDTAERTNPWSLPRSFANLYNRPQFVGQFWVGVAAWPAIWQYSFFKNNPNESAPLIGKFMRQPDEVALNALETNSDKTRDLGWVFTVIAGVLNILVIYDAIAGPAFRAAPAPSKESEAKNATATAIASH